MGMTAARHAREIVGNAETVLALEALAAAQALDLRAPLRPATSTHAVHDAVRERIPFTESDHEFGRDIAAGVDLVRSGALVEAAETIIGELA